MEFEQGRKTNFDYLAPNSKGSLVFEFIVAAKQSS